jgi:two-component system cell cycle sensor histidine kinase/response regulator CckA
MEPPAPNPTGFLESRFLFDASLDAILVSTTDGEFLAANPAACRLLGRTEDELRSLGRAGVIDATDGRLAVAIETREKTGRFAGELTFIRASGERFPAEIASSVFLGPQGEKNIVLVVRDVSERRRTEAALRASEERFAKAFHTSPDGITISRLSDGTYLEVNPGFVAISGYPAEEVIGKTSVQMGIWIHGDDRAKFVQALAVHGQVVNWELDFRFNQGVIKNTLVSARIMELNGEQCILSTTRDMTDRRVFETQLAVEKQRVAESLQRAQKLESLGLLAGGIAHDFNNMLGGIFGFLELARDNLAAGRPEKVPHYLERALGIHGRAKSLTHQLLTFAKGGEPVRKTFSLEPLVRQTVAFALSGSSVTCEFLIDDGLWACDGDEDQLGQAIDNLVLNAKQAMPQGGILRAVAKNISEAPGHPGAYVQVSIVDQGRGIDPDDLPRVFDPFFTTKETGHGLGLATVHSIVSRHGGWVDVASVPGEGAAFHLFLPASPAVPRRTEAPASDHHGSGSLLLLDDEEALLEVLSAMVGALGYRAVACRQSDDAVRLFDDAARTDEPFVAAILDLTIPGGTGGAEAALRIRKRHPRAIIIAASGYSDSPTFQHPEEFGFSGRIAKPYFKADVAAVLERLLGPAVRTPR